MANVVLSIPIIHTKGNMTDEDYATQMVIQVSKLLELGAIKGNLDDILKDYTFDHALGYISITIPEEAVGMTNNLEAVAGSICPTYIVPEDQLEQNIIEASDGTLRTFSIATINERMRLALKPTKVRFRYLILDYKRFFKAKEKQLKENKEMATKFRNMFITDVMGMMTEVLPLIVDGKQLGTIIGVNQVSPKLQNVSRQLSLIYRRALKQEKANGVIQKNLYGQLKNLYSEFISGLVDVVMPGLQENKEPMEGTKKYSRLADGRIDLFKKPARTFSIAEETEDSFIEACKVMAKDVLGDNYDEAKTIETAKGIWKDQEGDSEVKLGIFRNSLTNK